MRPPIFDTLTTECEHCGGAGRVYTPATMVRRIERSLVRAQGKEKKLVIRLHPDIAIEVLECPPAVEVDLAGQGHLRVVSEHVS